MTIRIASELADDGIRVTGTRQSGAPAMLTSPDGHANVPLTTVQTPDSISRVDSIRDSLPKSSQNGTVGVTDKPR